MKGRDNDEIISWFIFGAIVGVALMWFLYDSYVEAVAIKEGYGQFNQQTGDFQWKHEMDKSDDE